MAVARMISQAVNEAMNIEDSREMRRPGLGGRPEAAFASGAPPARAADPVLPMVLTPDELARMLRVRRRSVY